VGQYGSASGSILLGLDGFEVTDAEVINEELKGLVAAGAIQGHKTRWAEQGY
jgi:hypothetical protein